MKRDSMKNQMLRYLTSVTSGLLIFLCSSNCIANGTGVMARAIGSTVKITIVLRAAEDSTAVVQYSASLVDASTSTTLDSLGSGTVNVITFNVVGTGVSDAGSTIPSKYSLDQNFPNPFNPSTLIRFSIPGANNVQLSVYDILGRRVATPSGPMAFLGHLSGELESKCGIRYIFLQNTIGQVLRDKEDDCA